MSSVKTNTSTVNQTNTAVSDGWNDSQHSSFADFMHRHCPKITNDVDNVAKDLKTGCSAVADMGKQVLGSGEDIIDKIKTDGGFRDALKKTVQDIEKGKDPLKGVINPDHIKALKSDAETFKANLKNLETDTKPLEQDIIQGMTQAKGATVDVLNMIEIAKDIYGGQVPPDAFSQLSQDAHDILRCLENALQWNPATQPHNQSAGG